LFGGPTSGVTIVLYVNVGMMSEPQVLTNASITTFGPPCTFPSDLNDPCAMTACPFNGNDSNPSNNSRTVIIYFSLFHHTKHHCEPPAHFWWRGNLLSTATRKTGDCFGKIALAMTDVRWRTAH
jgi:hypothetical protein